jgi:hypothetical protein
MGLVEDVLVLVGVLPLERPDFKRKEQKEKLYVDKAEQLEKLSGQTVIVDDKHNGAVEGELVYSPCMGDNYILNNYSIFGKTHMLKVNDLERIN